MLHVEEEYGCVKITFFVNKRIIFSVQLIADILSEMFPLQIVL